MIKGNEAIKPTLIPLGALWEGGRSGFGGRTPGDERIRHRANHQRERWLVYEPMRSHVQVAADVIALAYPSFQDWRSKLALTSQFNSCRGFSNAASQI